MKNSNLQSFYRQLLGILCPFALSLAMGCSGGPGRVEAPGMDPQLAGRQAMDEYDTNDDGFVAGEELEKAPSLKAAMTTLDVNKDNQVSADEVAERVKAWQETKIGVLPIMCSVTLDGRPLEGATVTFDPEKFLGTEIKPAVGLTGPLGEFYPSITPADSTDRNAPVGVQLGLYKVRVSKMVNGNEAIPAKFNTETVLGQEVSNEDPAVRRHKIVFNLTTK